MFTCQIESSKYKTTKWHIIKYNIGPGYKMYKQNTNGLI